MLIKITIILIKTNSKNMSRIVHDANDKMIALPSVYLQYAYSTSVHDKTHYNN